MGAALYLLRHVGHDWSDPYFEKILERLHDAASPTSTLLVLDRIIPYACDSIVEGKDQYSLPTNVGGMSIYITDLAVSDGHSLSP